MASYKLTEFKFMGKNKGFLIQYTAAVLGFDHFIQIETHQIKVVYQWPVLQFKKTRFVFLIIF